MAEETSCQQKTLGNTDVYIIQTKDEPPIVVTLSHGVLAIGNEAGITKFLATAKRTAKALASSSNYRRVPPGAMLPNTAAALFIDMAAVMKRKQRELGPKNKELREMRTMGTSALRAIWSSAEPRGNAFLESITFDMGTKSHASLLGMLNMAKPIVFQSPGILRKWPTAHMALAIGNGKDLLSGIKTVVAKTQGYEAGKGFDAALEFFRTQLNMDIEDDLLARIGPEIFIAGAPNDLAEWVGKRKPRGSDMTIVAGFQIKDPKVVLFILKNVTQSGILSAQGWSYDSVTYKDTKINLAVGPKDGQELAYTIVDGFLLAALGRGPIQKVLEARSQNAPTRKEKAPQALDALPKKAIALIHLVPGPILKVAAPALFAKAAPKIQPFVPMFVKMLGSLDDVQIVVVPSRCGPVLKSVASLPVITTIASLAGLDYFGKAPVEHKVDEAREKMKEIAKGLRKYRRLNKIEAAALTDLVPHHLKQLPADPFAKGQPFGYHVSDTGDTFILTSVGPDGKADIQGTSANPQRLRALKESADDKSVAEVKQLIYRFRPKQYPDEKALDDEGDITHIGTW